MTRPYAHVHIRDADGNDLLTWFGRLSPAGPQPARRAALMALQATLYAHARTKGLRPPRLADLKVRTSVDPAACTGGVEAWWPSARAILLARPEGYEPGDETLSITLEEGREALAHATARSALLVPGGHGNKVAHAAHQERVGPLLGLRHVASARPGGGSGGGPEAHVQPEDPGARDGILIALMLAASGLPPDRDARIWRAGTVPATARNPDRTCVALHDVPGSASARRARDAILAREPEHPTMALIREALAPNGDDLAYIEWLSQDPPRRGRRP